MYYYEKILKFSSLSEKEIIDEIKIAIKNAYFSSVLKSFNLNENILNEIKPNIIASSYTKYYLLSNCNENNKQLLTKFYNKIEIFQ